MTDDVDDVVLARGYIHAIPLSCHGSGPVAFSAADIHTGADKK